MHGDILFLHLTTNSVFIIFDHYM